MLNSNLLLKLLSFSKYTLLIISVIIFITSLFFGASNYGNGLQGIIKNSPNSLPWLMLLFLNFIAWKWELIGGILLSLFGFGLIYFFNFSGPNFFLVTFIATSFITLLSFSFVVSWKLKQIN